MIKLNAFLLAAFSVFSAASARADQPVSSPTRAEVTAEYLRASAAGEVPVTGYESSATLKSSVASTLTRAQVQAEYVRAQRAGELRDTTGYASAANTPSASTLTRADVKNEFVRARSSGELAEISNEFGSPQTRRATR